MTSSIDTAIPLVENCVRRPSILSKEDGCSEMHYVDLGDGGDDDGDHKKYDNLNNTLNRTAAIGFWGQQLFTSWQFLSGFWLGFVIQTVSVGSIAIIETFYRANSEAEFSAFWMDETREVMFFVFFLLSQSWWLLLPVIFIAIDSGLTGRRRQRFLEKFFLKSCHLENEDSLSQPLQREVFIRVIRFHVGIVFGCFIVWSIIDLYVGASMGVFVTLTASFLACLGLCHVMIVIYDRCIIGEEQPCTRQNLLQEI